MTSIGRTPNEDSQKSKARTNGGDSGRLAVSLSSSSSDMNSKKDIESGRQSVVSPVAVAVKAVTESFLPKIQKVPWIHFFILCFFIAIPAVGYILLFTKMGYGLTTFYYLSKYYEQHSFELGGSLAGFAFLLYLLDCYYWQSKLGRFMRMLSVAIIVIGVAVLVCFISATHPYGPISIYVVLMPLWLVLIRRVFYRHISMRTFVPWLSGPLFLNSVLVLAAWITWTWWDPDNKWILANRLADAEVSGCRPDLVTYPICENKDITSDNEVCFSIENNQLPVWTFDCPRTCIKVWDTCFNQFIVWVGPFLVSLGLFFLCFFATFLRSGGTVQQEAVKFAKIWGFLLFTMWISASLAGAGAGLSTTLAALTLSSFVASAVLLAASFNAAEREEQLMTLWQKLLDNYGTYLDVAKGLVVVTCLPVAVVYLSVSFLVQCIRRMKLQCSRQTDDNDDTEDGAIGASLLTIEARNLVKEFRSWNLATVYTYAVYWGAVFITFTVLAAKFTVLFLSWLIEETKTMDVGAVTGILFLVGVIMFLLPPVPGAPIYITLGIVIVPVGRDAFGLVWCIVYAMGVSVLLKLFATFLQQKMIGGLLKNSVQIRQLVGINTGLIRAMKLCLNERGLGIAKVSILCGGPDWPTSVLCGIMDLPLIPVLVGTLPVAALVIPTVLTGSFTYMSSMNLEDGNPEFPWAGIAATISTAISAVVLFGFMLLAAYYVEQTMSTKANELKEMPYDEEVKLADDADVALTEAYQEVTQWKDLPAFAQILLLLSLACMITSCYMIQLFQDDSFAEYQLTYNINDHLNGDWKNLVKPIGLVAILLFLGSIFFLLVFKTWANRKARRLLKERSKRAKLAPAQAIEGISPSQSSNEANATVDTSCTIKNYEDAIEVTHEGAIESQKFDVKQ